jgi:hypothetical protein
MTNSIIHSALESKRGKTVHGDFDVLTDYHPFSFKIGDKQNCIYVIDKPAYVRLVERDRPENKLLGQATSNAHAQRRISGRVYCSLIHLYVITNLPMRG